MKFSAPFLLASLVSIAGLAVTPSQAASAQPKLITAAPTSQTVLTATPKTVAAMQTDLAAEKKQLAELDAAIAALQAKMAKQKVDLKNDSAALSKNSELNMIKLQDLISKRGTMIQLITSMMSSLDAAQKVIAGNIGQE